MNPHSYVISLNDNKYSEALRNADLLIPDGVGIIIASQFVGKQLQERITGSDIFYSLSQCLHNSGFYTYYFLGSKRSTLDAIARKMTYDFNNIKVVGTYSPPFKREFTNDDNKLIIDHVNRVKPDVLWVGMTAPKQEKWIHQNKDKLNVKFIGAIGAVFDFYAGNVKRSHPWFLKHGLEWLPRLLQEPKRLWKRTFISAPIFIWHVLMQRIRK